MITTNGQSRAGGIQKGSEGVRPFRKAKRGASERSDASGVCPGKGGVVHPLSRWAGEG